MVATRNHNMVAEMFQKEFYVISKYIFIQSK